MTAEIAVLNKQGVALAADSAVTIGDKVYNSANKLFLLSKYHPVGIMIFGNAEFMGIPWETIIKHYRSQLGKKSFEYMHEYSEDFFSYLANFRTAIDEKRHLDKNLESYFKFILEEIEQQVEKHLNIHDEISEEENIALVKSVIDGEWEYWKKISDLPGFPKDFAKKFVANYSNQVREKIKEVFQKVPIEVALRNKLVKISPWLYCKNRFPSGASGLVFAGFGEGEFFPIVRTYNIDSAVMGYVKYVYDESKSGKITDSNSATVIPFAQTEMVATFMEGIDPKLASFSDSYLRPLFEQLPLKVLEKIDAGDGENKAILEKELKKVGKQLHEEYLASMTRYRRFEHVAPIIDMVAVLPKDELASMAEALVNLTSFKRRITAETETVGGPIDVAVISKADGFVWITRKHYFKPEYNHHFFSNYYREICDELPKEEN